MDFPTKKKKEENLNTIIFEEDKLENKDNEQEINKEQSNNTNSNNINNIKFNCP